MTKTCNHHFLVNQEKGEKHVFRKSKKYRTLCSVALGTMVTAVVAWGGTVAHADEVTPSVDTTIQRTENPATNLPLFLNKLKVWHQLDNLTVQLLSPYHMIR